MVKAFRDTCPHMGEIWYWDTRVAALYYLRDVLEHNSFPLCVRVYTHMETYTHAHTVCTRVHACTYSMHTCTRMHIQYAHVYTHAHTVCTRVHACTYSMHT
eukprot:Lankesteria_metandrocarpae@DN2879_c0_g2_i1.p2